jgi:SAM-dependent methyltransferase
MTTDIEPICAALGPLLPPQGLVLEIASGAGEHVAELARRFGFVAWQPSEVDPGALAAIGARCEQLGLPNLLRPVALDVAAMPWPNAKADAIVCLDAVHVIAWNNVVALFGGAARALQSGGLLFLSGPFKFHGKYATPANEELDQSLRARDPSTGLRDIRELTVAGTRTGLGLEHTLALSPTHHALVFRRRALLPPTGQFRVC